MHKVILKSTGFYAYLDEESNTPEKLDGFEFSRRLTDTLEIEETITVENLFNILMEIEDDVNTLFRPWTRGFKLHKFYEDLNKDPDDEVDNLDYIELSWKSEIYKWEDDDCVEQSNFEYYVDVCGIDDSVKEEDIDIDNSRRYGIDLLSLSTYKHLPIKIENKFTITSIENGEYKELIKSTKEWDVWNFVGGFLYEISFHGYPENHQEFIDKIKEVEDRIESGEEKLIPFEEVQIEFLEKKLKRLEEEEKYEKAAKVKAEIEELKSKLT